jgi:hypothetical protein
MRNAAAQKPRSWAEYRAVETPGGYLIQRVCFVMQPDGAIERLGYLIAAGSAEKPLSRSAALAIVRALEKPR